MILSMVRDPLHVTAPPTLYAPKEEPESVIPKFCIRNMRKMN